MMSQAMRLAIVFLSLFITVNTVRAQGFLRGDLIRDEVIERSLLTKGGPAVTDAVMGEFPFFVRFSKNEGGSLRWCGGTLIWEDVVLTTAKCLDRGRPEAVLIGASTEGDGNLVPVCNSAIHPNYDSTFLQNNVGLIFLCQKVHDCDAAILNKKKSYPSLSGQNLTVVGMGIGTGTQLQKLQVSFFNDTYCAEEFGSDYIPEQSICADNVLASPCSGDTGAPLFDDDQVVVGIFNFFIGGTCNSTFSDYYVEVAQYTDWIDSLVCDNAKEPPRSCGETPTLFGIIGDGIFEVANYTLASIIIFLDNVIEEIPELPEFPEFPEFPELPGSSTEPSESRSRGFNLVP